MMVIGKRKEIYSIHLKINTIIFGVQDVDFIMNKILELKSNIFQNLWVPLALYTITQFRLL
jgi:hypothetical protein